MNRGSEVDARGVRSAVLPASMRPRFMNRGSGQAAHPIVDAHPASMRPRFMNRGSILSRDPPGRCHDVRFNEAPIHESGK